MADCELSGTSASASDADALAAAGFPAGWTTPSEVIDTQRYILVESGPSAGDRCQSRISMTMKPLLAQFLAWAVPPKAGPCLVQRRRSGEVATKRPPWVPLNAV